MVDRQQSDSNVAVAYSAEGILHLDEAIFQLRSPLIFLGERKKVPEPSDVPSQNVKLIHAIGIR
jgi:hypothetical protein